MFKNLSNRFSKVIQNINDSGVLTEKNIKNVLGEVRVALLEADVSLQVIDSFINTIKEKALGHIIRQGLTPSQEFINIVYKSLISIIGERDHSLCLSVQPPAVFLIVGFQGSGKTTTCAKLAKYLYMKMKKKVLISSVDIYRPSGVKQLEILTKTFSGDFFQIENFKKEKHTINNIASHAFSRAKLGFYDVLLVDTPGCLSTDVNMISKIADLSSCLNPVETLFVVDAMIGQESASTAALFHSKVPLTGVILTKVDGDSRGGAALSIYHKINKPVKFVGTGEKIDDLERFYASRMASRILGMGDVLSLIEDIKNKVDNVHVKKTLSKLNKGDSFDLSDFLNQLQQMRNMGGMNQILNKLPVNSFLSSIKSNIDDKSLRVMEVIISSMTVEERKNPQIIRNSRKRRISFGSGVSVQEVDMLLKRFESVQSMMRKIKKNGLSKVMESLQNRLSSGFSKK